MRKIGKLFDKAAQMKYIYGKYFNSPIEDKTILFESFHGKEISDSPLAMAIAMLSRPEFADFNFYFSTNDTSRDQSRIDALNLNISLVHIHSNEYARLLATAGTLINNSSFPSYFIRRSAQKYLQTWHGF